MTVFRACLAALFFSSLQFSINSGADAAEADYPLLVGRGMVDITGPIGVKMLGFVRSDHVSRGIHTRQYARAFVIADPVSQRRLAIVTADLGTMTHSVVLSVLDRLRAKTGDAYRLDNVLIAATHTHSAPGGFWHYGAGTIVGSPFYREYFDALVGGIAESILAAHADLGPGRVLVAAGEVQNAGAQRSRVAYMQNPEAERRRFQNDIDTEMTLLKFDTPAGPIGALNWYPVHPTSMTFNNHLISSDHKGHAARSFERTRMEKDFVAAFAQSNCGDVTPNLNLDNTGPGENEFESTRVIAERQLRTALRLFDEASRPLAPTLDTRFAYVDFANLLVRGEFTGAGEQRTCPAAFGYSFAAGSTEDGGGHPLFKEGMKVRAPLIDTLSRTIAPLPAPSDELRRCHEPKPILFAPGAADPPAMPHVLPLWVARLGELVIVAGPAEFTTMSGRRFRDIVRRAIPDAKHVIVAGYTGDYVNYVTTREEYESQQYEGASTLFGPWTQAAYMQEFARLAADLAADRPSETASPPVDVRGAVKPTPLETDFDLEPPGSKLGAVAQDAQPRYKRGELAGASFWTGNPINGYRPGRHFVAIDRQTAKSATDPDDWTPVFRDGDWELKCRWSQPSLDESASAKEKGDDASPPTARVPNFSATKVLPDAHLVSVEFAIPADLPAGTYRIRHLGQFKTKSDPELHAFTATSRPFVVE